MQFNENFISHLWKYQRFSTLQLQTVQGDAVVVHQPGILNHNAGPDFLMSKVSIGEETWNGSVELHVKTSDWKKHGHTNDPKYSNVILHVVWEHDVNLPEIAHIPTLEVKDVVSEEVLLKYAELQKPYQHIPCERQVKGNVDTFVINSWLNRLLVERLEDKTSSIQSDYLLMQSNLNEAFYRLMAKGFGQKINQTGFDALTQNLPLKILLKHSDKLLDLEALLFGVAGFLKETEDEYGEELKIRFQHFQRKYELEEIADGIWNFMRLRPPNFPTVRIAQFAALIHKSKDFLQLPSHSPDFANLQNLLHVKASEYWDEHYRFGKVSERAPKWISKQFFQHLVRNVFVPFVFYYKRRTGGASFEWVEEVLSKLPAEDNKITRKMEAAGFANTTSNQSQALYHLYNSYCSASKCVSCAIGNTLLK